MKGILADIAVARKLIDILNMLYDEGTKSQVEKMLVSDIEDELEEERGEALDDELFTLQRRRVRNCLIQSGILYYDENVYCLLNGKPDEEQFQRLEQALERMTQNAESATTDGTGNIPTETGNATVASKRFLVGEQDEEFKMHVLELVRNMQPFEFERLTTKLLRACGLEFYPGHKTGDDGIDGYGYLEVAGLFKFKVLVQCKRYSENNKIANYAIRDLRGAVSTDAYKGLFVTTSSFTPRAKQEAEKFPQIDMIDGRMFADLLVKNRIGISEEKGYYTVDEDYFKHIELEDKR